MANCIYLRKSRTDMEAEQRGELETLARHEAALLDLAKRLQLSVTQIYREIVSGDTIAARPVMQQLLAEVELGLWEGVLVMEVERLARGDTIDQGIMAQAFKYSGTKIHTPMKTYDPDNEFDEEYFEFGLFMSRREYKTINRRLQRGRLASVQEGKYVGSGCPYGYNKIKLESAKGFTLSPHERQAPIVQTIFDWYVNGIEGVRIGVSAIANKLNGLGIPPVKGDHWSPSTIRDILTNPVYIGKVRWNWRPVVKKVVDGQRIVARPRRDEYDLVDGLHSAIVEEAIWARAQALARANSVPKTKVGGTLKNPLAGLIVCGKCGNRMVRKPHKSGAKDTLLCVTPGCKTVSALLPVVEEQLLVSLADWLAAYEVTLKKGQTWMTGTREAILDQLEKDLKDTEKQKEKLHDLLERDIYDTNTFLTRSKAVADRIQELQSNIQAQRQELEQERFCELRRAKIAPAVAVVLKTYGEATTPVQKNALLKEVLDKVVYTREQGGRWSSAAFTLHVYPKIKLHL